MVELKLCKLVIEKGKSKKNNEYYGLYLITEKEDKIFITFVTKAIFDNLQKI